MSKLEAYGIALVAFLVISVGCFFFGDFYGRLSEKDASQTKLDAANQIAVKNYTDTMQTRETADQQAQARTVDLISAVDKGIDDVQKRFGSLPATVLDSRGCARLTDTARLRWNSVELLPTGSADQPADNASGAVPTGAVPAPR